MAQRDMPGKTRKSNLKDSRVELPRVKSSNLRSLRDFVEASVALKKIVGSIVQFHIVIDANILIRQVVWASKRKNPAAITHLHECIQAGTIIVYATTRVVSEVEEHLPLIAAKKGADIETYRTEWLRLKPLLLINDPDEALVAKYGEGRDPDDAPTIALAEALKAIGILTDDNDISAMGGTIIPESFIAAARDYSRQATLNVTIQISGYYIAVGTGRGLMGAISILQRYIAWIRHLRTEYKAVLFLAVLACLIHPRARQAIISTTKTLTQHVPEFAGALLQLSIFLSDIMATNPAVPPSLTDHATDRL
jgi:predicted nucleic acid-binding protein